MARSNLVEGLSIRNLPFFVTYAVGGLMLVMWPLVLRPARGVPTEEMPSWVRSVPTARWVLWGAALGLLFGTTLPWWRRYDGFSVLYSWSEAPVVAAIAGLFAWQFTRRLASSGSKAARMTQTTAFAAAITALSFSTLTYQHQAITLTAWHHWGAYISSAELLLAGARIFSDFPAQYGLGPTLLIAVGCAESCWTWTYYAVGVTTLLFAALTTALALRVAEPLCLAQRGMVLLLCIACCFFWAASPNLVSSPTATPSVTGMRFLPVVALALLLLRADREGVEFPYAMGHAAWALAALWSFDSAFFATCTWWPHYLLLRLAGSREPRLTTLLRATGTLLFLSMAWIAGFLAVYWLIYGTSPTTIGLFAFFMYPPGPLPLNMRGALWFFVASITLATWVNVRAFRKSGNTPEVRHGLVLALLAYSSFAYFLSRSHDNNVLNLLPFILLLLLHAWARTTGFAHGIAVGLLTSLMCLTVLFDAAPWRTGVRLPGQSWFNPNWIEAVVPGSDPGLTSYPQAMRDVVARTQSLAQDPVTAVPMAAASSRAADAVWNAVHNPANLLNLEPAARREFVWRSAKRLRRSGWLVVAVRHRLSAGLVADFDSAYTRTMQFETKQYLAIHFTPK